MKKIVFSFALLWITLGIFASSRSYSEKLAIAKMVLQDLPSSATLSSFSELQILQENQALSVIGYSQCGYVVIANDNRFNAVIGYSAKAFQENNGSGAEVRG